MVLTISRELDETLPVLSNQCPTLRRSPTCRVRNRQEREDRTQNKCGVLCSRPATKRVASLVLVITDGGHDQIRAVHGDHTRLRKAGARVVLLHSWVHAHERNNDTEREVERDEEAIECASGSGKEGVEDTGERDRCGVHSRCRADENPLPKVRIRLFPVLKTCLRPRVREVDEENEAEEDEYRGTNEGDIVAPEHEKAVRDEEGYGDQDEPEEDLGTPPSAVLEYENKWDMYILTHSGRQHACPWCPVHR